MDYLLLIREPRGQRAERTEPEGRAAFAVMNEWADTLKAKGALRAVSSLLGDDQGARVEVREGRVRTLDGPFVESKEMIGGFFLVTCETKAEALALAAECPAAAWATVEVRPAGPCYVK
jgi:hypothetical protein